MRYVPAAALVASASAAVVLAGAPAYAEFYTLEYADQVPLGACADVPATTPGLDVSVGDVTVRVPVITDAQVCATAVATVYADAHLLPTAWTACLYGPAAYSNGNGVSVTDTGAGATYTADGTPTVLPLASAPAVGVATDYFELLDNGYGFARCP